MKTTDFIYVGLFAVVLYLLWKASQDQKATQAALQSDTALIAVAPATPTGITTTTVPDYLNSYNNA